MRKIILGALLLFSTLIATDKASAAKIDTLSYITGLQVASEIENEIVPQLKLDYQTIVKTLEKQFAKSKPFKVEGVTISPENINEIGRSYFNQELQARIMAAKEDETGNTEIFPDPKEKKIVSTLIGADFAYRLAKSPQPIDKKSFMKGISDSHVNKAKLTIEEANKYLEHYFTVIIPQNNRVNSEKWLAKIAKQKGVNKSETGLLYKIENPGDMNIKANKDADVVKVLYTGRTRDGKVFDSNRWADMSKERRRMSEEGKDSPIEFPLNRVIKGWTEGMKFVGKGGRITLWIPAELAYGERGAGQDIGPNEALCFDVEVLDVTNK